MSEPSRNWIQDGVSIPIMVDRPSSAANLIEANCIGPVDSTNMKTSQEFLDRAKKELRNLISNVVIVSYILCHPFDTGIFT